MLTAKANFLETIKGGSPDRFVKQFEYLELILDPILTGCGGFCDLGQQRTNDWGVTVYWQEGTPGPFPLCEGDDKKIMYSGLSPSTSRIHSKETAYSFSLPVSFARKKRASPYSLLVCVIIITYFFYYRINEHSVVICVDFPF